MAPLSFFDLVQQDAHRDFVSSRLSHFTHTPYSFPNALPILYQYKPLSSYAIDDICSGNITATSIGEFNDLFDGALHRYGNEEAINLAAEAKWKEYEAFSGDINMTGLIDHDYLVGLYKDHYRTDSRLKFRMLDYLGTYVSCFSSKNDSILMWSHYSKSNTGICVEYDFSKLPANHLLSKTIFPIAYTNSPVELSDLMDDDHQKIHKYPIDAAALCVALNKSTTWSYENEWRLVWILATLKDMPRRLSLKTIVPPKTIHFGYHFLRPLFYYKNKDEYAGAKKNIEEVFRLLDFMEQKNIKMSIMRPEVGAYTLKPYNVKIEKIKRLIARHFRDNEPENIRYYYTIHDELMEIIDED